MANRNKNSAVSALAGLAKAGKDATTIKNKKSSKKEKQAAKKRLTAYSSGNRSVYVPKQTRPQNRQTSIQQRSQHKRPAQKQETVKKPEKTGFEKLIDRANANIRSRGMKTTSRMEVYKQKNTAKARQMQAYKSKQQATQQKQEAERAKQSAKAQVLSSYDKAMKGPYSNAARKTLIKEKKKAAKGFDTIYENEQAKAATKELDKRLTQMGAKGLAAQQKEVRESRKQIAKEAKRQQRLDKANQISAEEQSIITKNAMAGTPEKVPKHIRKKKQYQEQKQLDRADSFRAGGYGAMNGAMPFSSYVKELEKRYGIKLDDTKLNERTAFQVGNTVGFLGASMLTGAPVEKAAIKVGTKILQKAGKKAASSKAAKAAVKVGADVASGLPMNIADSAKNSDNLKDFGKQLAKNTALDIGASGVLHGTGAAVKKVRTNRAATALVKAGKGQALSEAEQKSLKKVAAEVMAKKATGREETMTATHKAVAKALESGKLQTMLGRTPHNTTSKVRNPVTKIKDAAEGRKADKAFSHQVDKVLTGELKPSEELVLGKTPRKLQEHGANDIVMTMKQSTVKKTAYPAGYMDALKGVETRNTQGHNLGIGTVKQIRKDLENPVAILKSDTQRDSFVVFTNKVDEDNKPVMVALHLDKDGKIGVSNEVASEYGRSSYKQFIQTQREKGNVLYEDKKTGLDSLPGSGLRLPELGDTSDPINTLYQNGGKVNKKEIPHTTNTPLQTSDPVSTPDNAYTNTSNRSIPNTPAKRNPESLKIGDTVDDATIQQANRSHTGAAVDLDRDPAVKGILAKGRTSDAKGKPSFVKRLSELNDTMRQKCVDSMQGIEKMGRKMKNEQGDALVHQASAMRRASEMAVFNLNQKQTDFNHQIIGKGGFEILTPIVEQGDDVYETFNAYLFHNLNIDRYKNNKTLFGEGGVTDAMSEQIVRQMDEIHPDFREAAEEVWQFFRNHGTVRVQSGLITQGKQDLLQSIYEHYVPAYRQIDKKALEATAEGIRIDTGIKTAKGGDQDILPIHEQMIATTQKVWQSAQMNETIYQIAKAQGLEKSKIAKEIIENADSEEALEDMLNRTHFFEVDQNSVKVTYYEKGEVRETHISPLIYEGLKKWTAEDAHIMLDRGAFDKLLSGFETAANGMNATAPGKGLIKVNDIFKALITSYNPFFLLRNFAKDMQDIPVNSSNLTGFVFSMPKAFKAMSTKNDWWQTYLATGARYSGIMDPEKALKPKSKAGKILTKPLDLLEQANMAVESYPRFTEFCNILRQEGVTDIKQATRKQLEKAAYGACDITCDFGRSGSLVAPLNRSAVPFLNASIQGADKLWRVLKGQKGFRGYVALGAKLAALGAAPAVAQEIIYANDPDYQQLHARDRAGNYFIKNADGTFWKIPRGRTTSTLTNPFQQLTRVFMGNDELSIDEFWKKVLTDIAPVNPMDANILAQLVNTVTNQTWYGGNIEGYYDSHYADGTEKPKVERYNPRSSKIGLKISEATYHALNELFGEEVAEKYTASPMKWDYLIDSYGGIASDIALSATRIGKTKGWWAETFDTNFKKDPVYSNNNSEKYYTKKTQLEKIAKGKDATIEDKAKGELFKVNDRSIKNLQNLQTEIRFDQTLDIKDKAAKDRALQKAINDLRRNGASEQTLKAVDAFIQKNKDSYMSPKQLGKAAQQEHEKQTHSTVKSMELLYEYGGMKAVLKNRSSYIKDGEKVPLNFSRDKTIGKIYKGYTKDGGKDADFYKLYRKMMKENAENGCGTDAKHANLAAVLINTSKNLGSKKQLKKAFGVTKEADALVDSYLNYGGSRKEALKAQSIADCGANTLRDKQKDGSKKDYNHDAPFKARALAESGLSDRAYLIINSPDVNRKAIYFINNSRGLKHHKISLKTLQELDNKVKKNKDGWNTKEGVEKVVDATNYSREAKALLWEALYGLSYRETNPYGSIRDFSLKSDVGIDTSGGWKDYGGWGYRRYGRRYRGYGRRGYGRGSSGGGSTTPEKTDFEKYVESLARKQKTQRVAQAVVQAAKTNGRTRAKSPSTTFKRKKLNVNTSDAYRKAIVKLLAKKIKEG